MVLADHGFIAMCCCRTTPPEETMTKAIIDITAMKNSHATLDFDAWVASGGSYMIYDSLISTRLRKGSFHVVRQHGIRGNLMCFNKQDAITCTRRILHCHGVAAY